MKKTIVLLAALSLIVVAGCSFKDIGVDRIEVHNGLVLKMEALAAAETDFYTEYWSLYEGVDTAPFAESYEAFTLAVEELDAYFEDTTFASSQDDFIEEYNDYYKPMLDEYVEYAGEFVENVE